MMEQQLKRCGVSQPLTPAFQKFVIAGRLKPFLEITKVARSRCCFSGPIDKCIILVEKNAKRLGVQKSEDLQILPTVLLDLGPHQRRFLEFDQKMLQPVEQNVAETVPEGPLNLRADPVSFTAGNEYGL